MWSQLVYLVYPIVKFALSEKFVIHMLGNTKRDSDAACILLLTSNEVLDRYKDTEVQHYSKTIFFPSIDTLLDKTSVCL